MKKHIYKIIVTFIIISSNSFAQDLIVKKSGEEINAKIIEVGAKEVKYKNSTNIEGPTYVIEKSEIVFVKYKNGEKEIFAKTTIEKTNENLSIGKGYFKGDTEISKQQFEQLLSTNQNAYSKYKHGRLGYVLGPICAGVGAGMLGFSLAAKDVTENKTMRLLAGGVCLAAGVTMIIIGKSEIKNAVKTYNKSKPTVLNLNINSNGVGVAMQF